MVDPIKIADEEVNEFARLVVGSLSWITSVYKLFIELEHTMNPLISFFDTCNTFKYKNLLSCGAFFGIITSNKENVDTPMLSNLSSPLFDCDGPICFPDECSELWSASSYFQRAVIALLADWSKINKLCAIAITNSSIGDSSTSNCSYTDMAENIFWGAFSLVNIYVLT